jgi:hypothetical protein
VARGARERAAARELAEADGAVLGARRAARRARAHSTGASARRACASSRPQRRAQSASWSSPMRPEVEVRGLRVREVEAADAGRRRHGQALGEAHADLRRPPAPRTSRA